MHGTMMELTVPKSARGPHTNRDYRLVVVGHRAVGKSAMVVRFLTKRFISEYLENSEMTCNGVVEIDGEKLTLNIQDTSEKGIRVPTVDHHLRWADAIMLVYSIIDKMSYQRLRSAIARLKEKLSEQDPVDARIPAIVVVGNKGDLEHMRRVTQNEGIQLADELGCRFFESSASEGWSKHISHAARNEQPSPKFPRKVASGATERPSTLSLFEKGSRRKSDPTIVANSIPAMRTPRNQSPLGDFNNNGKSKAIATHPIPYITVPEISISPSEDLPDSNKPSRGRRLMQKLSPRFSRKFTQASKSPTRKMSHIGASLASVGTAGLAVGSLNSKKSMTLPVNVRGTPSANPRLRTLRNSPKRNGGLWESSSSGSSSSSTESLNSPAKFFLRPETPEPGFPSTTSSDEDTYNCSDSTVTDIVPFSTNTNHRGSTGLRRSGTFTKNLNLLQEDRHGDSDSDSSKKRLAIDSSLDTDSSQKSLGSELNGDNKTDGVRDALTVTKFNSSEPFKHLCREARATRRNRDRKTPSQFLRDGIRKIRSTLVTEQAHNHNQVPVKQNGYHVAAVRH